MTQGGSDGPFGVELAQKRRYVTATPYESAICGTSLARVAVRQTACGGAVRIQASGVTDGRREADHGDLRQEY